jgi:hypothetical protein
MFDLKPDYEITKRRFDAFWSRELLDRPLVQFRLYKSNNERCMLPRSKHSRNMESCENPELQAKWHLDDLSNQVFLGDSLPVVCPSNGPAGMQTFYDQQLHTSQDGMLWNEPRVADFNDLEWLSLNWESPWLNRLRILTEACLHTGAGRFITGLSNWLVGADCLAAILGYQQFAAALIQESDWVRKALDRSRVDFERLYLEFHARLTLAGQPGTTWVPLLSDGRYYVIANDFSAMISTSLYRQYFLEGVMRECQFLDHSIYHLDGPDAVRHLDAILEVEELDGIHFIPSPTDAAFIRWADVYRRIQAAGKCLIVNCDLNEVDAISHTLKPEGLLLNVGNVTSIEEANDLLEFIGQWPSLIQI